jgi:hypothetical protein
LEGASQWDRQKHLRGMTTPLANNNDG